MRGSVAKGSTVRRARPDHVALVNDDRLDERALDAGGRDVFHCSSLLGGPGHHGAPAVADAPQKPRPDAEQVWLPCRVRFRQARLNSLNGVAMDRRNRRVAWVEVPDGVFPPYSATQDVYAGQGAVG